MNTCLVNSIRKVYYVSSISSLGKQAGGKIIAESVEWQANRHRFAYTLSKFMAEMEVWRAAEEGVNVVIVNPSLIIGHVE